MTDGDYDLIDRDYDLIDGESLLSVVVGVVSLLDGKALDLHDATFSVSLDFLKHNITVGA